MLLKTVLSSLLFLSAYGNFVSYSNSSAAELQAVPADPDVGKNMFEMAETRGYYMEEHFVTTPDGYILNMFRIPNGKKSRNTADSKPAVILQHGLLDSSFTWVNNFEDESLAYILADAGFDVWMGNNRGNRYGRNHTTLVPDTDEQFWMFTWDEMASLDMPAMVHYVTDVAEVDSVGWVGHSEGTIQMFAAASSLTGFNKDNTFLHDAIKKINLFVALAPVAYVNNLASRAIQVLAKQYIVDEIFDRGIYEIGKWDDKVMPL